MSGLGEEVEEPGNFTVRFSQQAQTDAIEIAWSWSERVGNSSSGLALHDEFHAVAGTLAYLPERRPIEQEVSSQLGMTLRRILVRRWNLYYEIVPDSDDGPLVWIVFIRDARLPSLTQDEVDRLKGRQLP